MEILSILFAPGEQGSPSFRKRLLFLGIALATLFFLPWAYIGGELVFSWDTIGTTGASVSSFTVLLLISGVALLVLSLKSLIPPLVKTIIVFTLGCVALLLVDFVQADMIGKFFEVAVAGFFLPLALIMISYGFNEWITQKQSTFARALIGVGAGLLLLYYFVPISTSFQPLKGTFWLALLFEDRELFTGALSSFVYRAYQLLPLAIVAAAGLFLITGGGEKATPKRAMALIAALYIPGSLLLTSMVLWIDKASVFFPFYLCVAALGYTIAVFNGAVVVVPEVRRRLGKKKQIRAHGGEPAFVAAGSREAAPAQAKPAGSPEVVQQLLDLQKSHEKGLITPEEYSNLKSMLLGEPDGAKS